MTDRGVVFSALSAALAVIFITVWGTAQAVFENVRVQVESPQGDCTEPAALVKSTAGSGAGLYQCLAGKWSKIGGNGPMHGTVPGAVVTYADEHGCLQCSNRLLVDLATLGSPAFTGAPTAPTPPLGDASQRLATTAFVEQAVAPVLQIQRAYCDDGGGCTPIYPPRPYSDMWGTLHLSGGTAKMTGLPYALNTTTAQCSCEDYTTPLQACEAHPLTSTSVVANGHTTDAVKWHCWD